MNIENGTLIPDIQKSFLNLLNDYLPKLLLEKVKAGEIAKILSIGCGRFREAKSLFDYFSLEGKVTGPCLLKLYGIEIDDELFKLAKCDPYLNEKKDLISLMKADASKFESYKEWISNGLFDLIIVRHPEITFKTDIFIEIFSHCASLLDNNGYLMVTTHFENEKEMLKLLLKLYKFNVSIEKENQGSPSIEVRGESRYSDKFLLIASK